MTIIALGCSFTDRYKKEIDPWPDIIAKRTGEKVINFGRCGTGNKYSLDMLLTHLRYGREVDTVYWLMTEFDRTDIITISPYGTQSYFFTLRPYMSGQDQKGFLKRWEESNLEKLPPGEQIVQKEWDRIYSETRIGKIIYDNTPTENYIDTNLMYIILIQKICKEFNIKLKIASALKPLWAFDPNDISLILKSKHNKELDLTTIMGYPFYKSAGGICAVEIKEWGEKYSVSSTDNHPNQAAHKLLADFFLGEKDIMNYR
jgi:hypothetical protein